MTAGGVVIAQVSDANDPSKQGRVKLTFPWLSDDYVSDWARTVQPGAGKDRGAMVLPEVGDEVLVAFEQGDPRGPTSSAGCSTVSTRPTVRAPNSSTPDPGPSTAARWFPATGTGSTCSTRAARPKGITAETGDGKLRISLDAVGTRKVTVHSDGTVLIEGKNGIIVDAATSNLELKGTKITITATNGVTMTAAAARSTSTPKQACR